MELKWMGQYRKVVEAMIGMGNAYSQVVNNEVFGEEIKLSPAQLQVMEYILETEDMNQNMSQIAQRLSISQSSFSKMTKQLVKKGMLERFHAKNNSKNVIVRVSEKGKEFYRQYSQGENTDVWRRIFKKLENVDKDTVKLFVECLNEFTDQMNTKPTEDENVELVKIK